MKVLVINCGSSSLKYQVLEMETEELLCKGLVERIGIEGSVIKHEKIGMDKWVLETPMKDHKDAIGHVLNALTGDNAGGDPFAASEAIQSVTGLPMPEQVRKLRELPVRHTAECDRDKMGEAVLSAFA